MKEIAVTVLRDCLCEDFESARQRLKRLDAEQLKELQRAAMALHNLTSARSYALNLWGEAVGGPSRHTVS
jgi:hypothetical protein